MKYIEDDATARAQEADMTPDFHSLCCSLLQAIDAGNLEAEESVLCRIRIAVREAEQAGQDTHKTMPLPLLRR